MLLCADEILFNADVDDIAFLVVGDPFGFVFNYFLDMQLHVYFIVVTNNTNIKIVNNGTFN